MQARRGFTLIELLVGMAILSIIVLSIARIYQESTVAWDSGWNRAQTMMVGRTVTQFIADEAALAVYDPANGIDPSLNSFRIVDGTNGTMDVEYEFQNGGVRRRINSGSDVPLIEAMAGLQVLSGSVEFEDGPGGVPLAAVVEVVVEVEDKGIKDIRPYTARAVLKNRERYRYD